MWESFCSSQTFPTKGSRRPLSTKRKGCTELCIAGAPQDYGELDQIWNGPHPEDGQELLVKDETPEGASWPELDEEAQLSSPGAIDPEMIKHFAKAL